jgi:two-component system NtrC family sensor kinase
MSSPTHDKPEYTLGHHEATRLRAMEEAFLNRPLVSIRLRIVAGFLLCFFLLAGTGLINLGLLYQARGKMHFLDFSQDLSLDIQQARHFSRLGFPDRANLREARDAAKSASDLLVAQGVNILDISSREQLAVLNYRLGHYVQLLDDALALVDQPTRASARARTLDAELDARSSEIMTQLRTMKAVEAASVNGVLSVSQKLPFVFAGIMLLIIFWITNLLANTITASLGRLQESTRRIAAGDYSLMTPTRRYRDELSDLSVAVNRMLLELRSRDAQVLKADRLASVGAFTAGIAQELNQILSSISASTRSFMEDCHPAEDCPSYALLEGIFTETERGREAVAGLLDFTREETIPPGPVDLSAAVEGAWMLLEHQGSGARVDFRAERPADLPPVNGVLGQLKQVFLNLFDNAVRAMPSGGSLTVRAGFLGTDQVEITVVDQGVGIEPADLPRVFDPSFTTREGVKGTGLGLSLSYALVRGFGGDIRIESVLGQGTTVHLTLPLVR